MTLSKEIEATRKEIVSDGYEMSFGEVINLYKDQEIVIDPEFQRLFRWEPYQKTRFIESLLLGIPIPPIFVFQKPDGVWELIDGLQRLSTVLEFAGQLRGPEGEIQEPLSLEGTKFLPSLSGKRWEESKEGAEDGIGKAQQLQIKRARVRVEILKQESDPQAKYELFQRLNTGGSKLEPQEVRNCVAVMINKKFSTWLINRSNDTHFKGTINQTYTALQKQVGVELALRFFAFRLVPYQAGFDVHEYLDESIVQLAIRKDISLEYEKGVFERTFRLLNLTLGVNSFKRWDGKRFSGKFLMSLFETVATGVSKNIDSIEKLPREQQKKFITDKVKALWENDNFQKNSGAGVRGTTRLTNLLPMAEEFFKP